MNRPRSPALALATALPLAACASSTPATPPPTPASAPTATSTAAAVAPVPWRSTPPTPGPAAEPVLPVFAREKLPNGLTVIAAQNRALPLVSLMLVVRGGSATDPEGRYGQTALAFELLGEGAGERDALAFSDAVADLGARFSTGADQDQGTIAISGLSRHKDEMLGLLADVALRPRLDKSDFERMQKQTLAQLVRQRGAPEGLAFEFVPEMVFGARHPYGHPANGVEATVAKLDLSQTRRHLAKLLVPSRTALIAVGDIDIQEAVKLAEKHLGRWKGPNTRVAPHAAVPPSAREKIHFVHMEAAPQTMIVFARPAFGRGHADEVPLLVANEVFGGSFTSRLNMNLREAKGYTYGARSSPSMRHGAGSMLAYSKVRADATAASVKEFVGELAGMAARPPSDTELERAKDGLIRSLPGAFETIGASASAAASLFVYDLPLDRYARRAAEVQAIGRDDVARVALEYLDPARMQILLVGDTQRWLADVEGLGLGPVVVRER